MNRIRFVFPAFRPVSARVSVVLFLGFLLIAGCVDPDASGSYHDNAASGETIYSEIAERSFAYEGPRRAPVVVIHGLLGARLSDTVRRENIWGDFAYAEMRDGEKFSRLAHPMGKKMPLRLLRNNVKATGLLEKSAIRIMGMEFELDNYDRLIGLLRGSGYVPDDRPIPADKNFYSLFIFYYDWRRDISENAAELEKFIAEKKSYLQRRYRELYGIADHPIRFDLIGHSMGGLVARYYVMYGGELLPEKENAQLPVTNRGAANVGKVIQIGTPNAGYTDTLLELTRGLKLSPGAPVYPKELIGTFVSYYQMLPDSVAVVDAADRKPVDHFNIENWIKYRWGLANPDGDDWLKILMPEIKNGQARREIAIEHLEKCLSRARQMKKALRPENAPDLPPEVSFYIFAGDSIMTNRLLAVDRDTGGLSVLRRDTGDGKVPAHSTTFDRRDGAEFFWYLRSPIKWRSVYFFPGGHMGLMNGEVFASNLRYLLLAIPPYGENGK